MIEGTTLRTGEETANEAALMMHRLQSGEVKPLYTGRKELDDALVNGLLPGTVLAIIGYSFQGKTYFLEEIQRNILQTEENDVVLVSCSWELEPLKIITRELASVTNQSAKEVMFNTPSEAHRESYKKAIDKFRKDGVYFQPEPVSSEQFEKDIMYIIDNNMDKRVVITIDNLENILVDKGSQKECMDKILYTINVLKKRHPFVVFIILNQMNNDYVKRSDNLKAHRPLSSDIYQTAQLFKIADVVVFKVMPTRFGISDKFMVFGTSMYDHLEDHKIPSTGATTSFDPYGKVFYFYLKARETDPEKFQDLHIDVMYTRADRGLPPANYIAEPVLPSSRTHTQLVIPPPAIFTNDALNNSSAIGEDFE